MPWSASAQIPSISLPEEELNQRIGANTRDARHFEALADLIERMANGARSGTNSVYPEYDPTRPIIPYLENLFELSEELGEPYISRARITALLMNSLACPNLLPEGREAIAPYYRYLRDSIGTSGSAENLELRLRLYGAIYFRCLREAFPPKERIEVAEALYAEPGFLDSQRIEISLFLILNHFTIGDKERGNEVIREVLRMAEQTPKAHRAKTRFYTMMADFFQQFTGDYEKGAELLELAQENLDQMDPAFSGFGNKVSSMLIETYTELKEFDKALAVHDAQINLVKEQSPENTLTDLESLRDFIKQLEFCRKAGDTTCHDQAKTLLNSIALIEAAEGTRQYAAKDFAYAEMGLYYYEMENFNKARPFLEETVKTILESRFYDREYGSEVLEVYLEISRDKISRSQLLEIYDQLYRWKDQNAAIARENSENKAAFELGVTENKLAKQRAEQQTIIAEQETASNRKFYTILLGSLALLLTVIGFSFYRSRQDAQKLSAQKALVDQSLGEKEVLLREIHHRVKNNLQIISSLLQKQARIAGDSDAKRMAKEGQERIQSMALIHENLYQSEQLSGVNIRTYLEDLGASIGRSNARPGTDINLDLAVADEYLDLDTAIPVGLILNELLTNAYKYAFPDEGAGQIKVGFQKAGDRFVLQVSDNGVGLPADHAARSSKSLGHNLVKGLVRQLEGDIIWPKPTRGTTVKIEF